MTIDEQTKCILLNQIEIMNGLALLLRYSRPEFVGKGGEMDGQRDDLLQRQVVSRSFLEPT